jgi:hypothetical protein
MNEKPYRPARAGFSRDDTSPVLIWWWWSMLKLGITNIREANAR